MQFMNQISSGTAFVVGAVAGVPSFIVASINNETFGLMGGIALGIIGLGWSIWRASSDQRFDFLMEQVNDLKKKSKEDRDSLNAVNEENVQIRKELSEVRANYELLKKRLAAHVCPIPADPSHKCTLPDLINITF